MNQNIILCFEPVYESPFHLVVAMSPTFTFSTIHASFWDKCKVSIAVEIQLEPGLVFCEWNSLVR